MKFYVGDTHFGHANVIKHDHRPFATAEEMDATLIRNWNSRVQPSDEVYVVGDFVYRESKPASWYLERLNGKKYFITGNHDGHMMKDPESLKYFVYVDKMMHVKDDSRQICVCHFPLAEWNGMYRGAWHIYAHVHNNITPAVRYMLTLDKALNCGVMINNYMPVTFDELVENNRVFREQYR